MKDLQNDEYSKKILELENILKEELAKESVDDDIGNEDFNNKINKIKSENQKEIELFEKQITELEQKNSNNIIIIDISNNNININNDYINNIQKNITDNIVFKKFIKSIEEKDNIMKDKIYNEANNLINTYFNEILNDVKNINNNMINQCINKKEEINEKINTIKKTLKIKDEKINNKEELENNMNKKKLIEIINNNHKDKINNINNINILIKNGLNSNKKQKKNETRYNKFLYIKTDPFNYSNKVESNLLENNKIKNILINEEYNSIKEEAKNNNILNIGYDNDNKNKGSKDNYKKIIFKKKNNNTNLNSLTGSNKNIFTKNQEDQDDSKNYKNISINSLNCSNSSNNSFYKLNKSGINNNNFKPSLNNSTFYTLNKSSVYNNILKYSFNHYKKKKKINFIKNTYPIKVNIFNKMKKFMNKDSDKKKNEDMDKNKDDNMTYKYDQDAKIKEKEKEIKKEPRKSYSIVKKIFFDDYYQKFVSKKKMDVNQKEIISKELDKERSENDENLKDYCLNFIEARILPLFKRKDLNYNQRQVLKYNIETILECCGESKKLYKKYYYPEVLTKKKEINRQKSMEVLKKFRKEYLLKKEDFCDKGLIYRLVENDYNMPKAFQKIFQ